MAKFTGKGYGKRKNMTDKPAVHEQNFDVAVQLNHHSSLNHHDDDLSNPLKKSKVRQCWSAIQLQDDDDNHHVNAINDRVEAKVPEQQPLVTPAPKLVRKTSRQFVSIKKQLSRDLNEKDNLSCSKNSEGSSQDRHDLNDSREMDKSESEESSWNSTQEWLDNTTPDFDNLLKEVSNFHSYLIQSIPTTSINRRLYIYLCTKSYCTNRTYVIIDRWFSLHVYIVNILFSIILTITLT